MYMYYMFFYQKKVFIRKIRNIVSVAISAQHLLGLAAPLGIADLRLMSIPAPRERFAGTTEDVAKVLRQHYNSPQYCTYATVNTGPQLVKLKQYKGLIRDLYALQSNLLFKNTQIQAALGKISSSWGLSKEEAAIFKKDDCLKLQVMVGQCKKALSRTTPPAWVLEIMHGKQSVTDLLQALTNND